MPESHLNADVLSTVLDTVSISNIPAVSRALVPNVSVGVARSYRDARCDPAKYMRNLTDRAEELLCVMGKCGVILSGSRAAEYFCPGVCNTSSDWDFFCHADVLGVVCFSILMKGIGVEWEALVPGRGNNVRDYPNFTVLRGTLSNGDRIHVVQLIFPRHNSPLEAVVKFHSSIAQCFITGYGAFCMYEDLTSSALSLPWCAEDEKRVALARDKYCSRGVKYVSYEWYSGSGSQKGKYVDHNVVSTRHRSLQDKDSAGIPFYRYCKDPRSGRAAQRCYRELVEAFSWSERPYACGLLHGSSPLPLTEHGSATVESVFPGSLHGEHSTHGKNSAFVRVSLDSMVDAAPWLSGVQAIELGLTPSRCRCFRTTVLLQDHCVAQ